MKYPSPSADSKTTQKRVILPFHAVWITVSLLLLTSCARQEHQVQTPIEPTDTFSREGKTDMPDRWWTALEDTRLNELMGQALKENFDLKGAWARLDQARAVARKEGATLWPQLDATASAAHVVQERDADSGSGASGGSSTDTGRTNENEFSLGLQATYEVDVWGKVRAATDAARLNAQASAADVDAAALSLTAQVANAWYQLVNQRAQFDLLEQQIATNKRYLELVTSRFQKGAVPVTDVLQQRKQIEAIRTDRERVQAELQTLRHQLAVLLGRTPSQPSFPEKADLPELPSLPDTGVPAEVLRQRPDVRNAYLRVRAKDRSVAAAIAEQYPRFTISGSFTTAATEPTALLEEWVAKLAGNMTAPLLDGGRREAEVARARAAAAESLYKYGQTLLTAVREVEDALSNEQKQRRALAGIRRQLRLSKQTLQQLGRKYRNGAVDFLKVLDEQRRYQTLQRQALTAHVRLVQDRINLYRALAGTWDLERPEKNRHGEDNAAKKGENQESSGDEANKKPASESGL